MTFTSFSDIIYHCFDLVLEELKKRDILPYQSSIIKKSRYALAKFNNGAELILTDCTHPMKEDAIEDFYGLIHYDCKGRHTFRLTYFVETNELDIDDFIGFMDNPDYIKVCSIK